MLFDGYGKNSPPLAGGLGGVPGTDKKLNYPREYDLGKGPDSTRKLNIASNAAKLRGNPTEAEKKLWYGALSAKRLNGHKFRRQQAIGDYVVDFVCMDMKLIIELDGGQHNEPGHRRKDERRTAYLESQGYQVIRFWNHEVIQNLAGVVDVILEALDRPRPDPGTPPSPPASGGGMLRRFCSFLP